MKVLRVNLQVQVGRWSVQVGNEHGSFRIILWKHHYADVSSGSFARWQWDLRSRPIVMEEPAFEIVCVGHLRHPSADEDWPEEVEDGS